MLLRRPILLLVRNVKCMKIIIIKFFILAASAACVIFLCYSSYAESHNSCSLDGSSLIAWYLHQAMHFLKVYKDA
jgi:hypothetical protein